MIIYAIGNLLTGHVYVGQTSRTLERRWIEHRKDAHSRAQFRLHRAMHKYGRENFSVEQLTYAETREDADNLEKLWIALLDSKNPQVGYNIANGGNVKKFSQETRRKLSEKKLGQLNPNYGKQLSDDTRQKLSAAKRGRGKSANHKEKIAAALCGRPKSGAAVLRMKATKRLLLLLQDAVGYKRMRQPVLKGQVA